MSIEEHVAECMHTIESRHHAREAAIATSRTLVRQCANTIRALHRSQFEDAARLLEEASTTSSTLRAAVALYPDLLAAGYTQDAIKEYVEATFVYVFLTGKELPSASMLHVEPAPFLNGLAEAASELRRTILDRLRCGDFSQVEEFLAIMDDVYSMLVTVDYPEALTGGLRRTTDALRSVLERTRGDVTTALRQEQLTASIEELKHYLENQGKLGV